MKKAAKTTTKKNTKKTTKRFPVELTTAELEEIQDVVGEAFFTSITFDHQFQRTRRRSGEIIEGSTRDSVDLGTMLETLKVVKTEESIALAFDTDYVEVLFAQRPELEELIVSQLNLGLLFKNIVGNKVITQGRF